MAERRINELLRLINQQSEYLLKAMALSQLTLSDDFLSHSQFTIYSYLWALNEMIERCEQLNQEAIERHFF